MKHMTSLQKQRGVTLVVGLIMLVLITLMVTAAFMMSTTNLKSVGNMQHRDEAIAAANAAIEHVVGLNFPSLAAPQPFEIDIDQNAETPPYEVTVTVKGCTRSTPAPTSNPTQFSGVNSGIPNTSDFDTVWELEAVVADANTGARVTVLQGIRKRLAQTDPDLAKCS